MSRESLSAWRQILRVANVFTAASNVLAGAMLTNHSWQPVGPLLLLVVSSMLLYLAGMVLNDVFDAKIDARQRPERPIPSGRISRSTAAIVGAMLMLVGVAFAGLASYLLGNPASVIVATGLALTILAYNASKREEPTFRYQGPLLMGVCRAANLTLGMTLAGGTIPLVGKLAAAAILFYTVGLTVLAADETTVTPRERMLQSGIWLTSAIIALASLVPGVIDGSAEGADFKSLNVGFSNYGIYTYYPSLGAFAIYVYFAWRTAYRNPGPKGVQSAVKRLILGFVGMDAVLCLLVGGNLEAVVILLLLVPTLFLARRTAMT